MATLCRVQTSLFRPGQAMALSRSLHGRQLPGPSFPQLRIPARLFPQDLKLRSHDLHKTGILLHCCPYAHKALQACRRSSRPALAMNPKPLQGGADAIGTLYGRSRRKKIRLAKGLADAQEFNAPHWEAPNGPPGGHFRAEEASPENLIRRGAYSLKAFAAAGDMHARPVKRHFTRNRALALTVATKPFYITTAGF